MCGSAASALSFGVGSAGVYGASSALVTQQPILLYSVLYLCTVEFGLASSGLERMTLGHEIRLAVGGAG